jgi:hypothetical protein
LLLKRDRSVSSSFLRGHAFRVLLGRPAADVVDPGVHDGAVASVARLPLSGSLLAGSGAPHAIERNLAFKKLFQANTNWIY